MDKIEEQSFYHYRLHRVDVDAMVPKNGDFILRRGTRNDPDNFTVSVRSAGHILHFPIFWVAGQCCFEELTAGTIQLFSKPERPEDQVGIAKISDFGMARKLNEQGIYQDPDPVSQIPIAWTAPEGLSTRKWSTTSDVWSMAVLIWEIFADGATPYSNTMAQITQAEVLDFLTVKKERLKPIGSIPPRLYELMLECWEVVASMRPPMWYVCLKLEEEWNGGQ